MAVKAVRYLVSGRVQGVYFRGATREQATRLGLAGWARNLPDGRVEVVAAGDPARLSELAEWLWKGPPLAVVREVAIEEWTGPVEGDAFEVR
ncbi:MAG TPA: acylphosphatase [Gammaproteobacteria bacterium]